MKIVAAALFALLLLPAVGARAEEPMYYDKGYITKDTTWSGTVLLRGQNVVKRGVTLTVLPGTVIKFVWIDDDGDNIGDGELTVEGRLVARGTKDRMITFTSAQEHPKMKDWTFVQLNCNKDSQVEYCRFEYAFSGLQVHYTTATIRNNLFQNNFEGIRFSTTDVLIEHNDIIDNYYGVRCEAHGSRTTITKNRLKGNDYTFFPVKKSWDTVKVFDNNIEGSKEYNIYFGSDQKQDMDFSNNWWGGTDQAAIEAGIFDHSKDENLGRAKFLPFLKEPVKDCGII